MDKKKTKEQFIADAVKVHGDAYDYSLVDYTGNKIKIKIVCRVHGEFEQTPNDHLRGRGCVKCGVVSRASKCCSSTEEFIKKAKLVHGNKYDYSLVDYKGRHTNVYIICKTHGMFQQAPKNHLKGRGCTVCGTEIMVSKRRSSTKEFISDAVKVHGDKYDYSLVEYIDRITKVKITCKEHGAFIQMPYVHLRGSGCKKCSVDVVAASQVKTTENFVLNAMKVHGNKYTYTNVDYVKASKAVTITCSTHGDFRQRPFSHLKGSGCPCCAESGFSKTKPAILYYLSINNGEVYKIGITNRTVKERFSTTDLGKIKVIKIWDYFNGADAYDAEQKAIKQYKEFKYTGPKLLSSGNTELFSIDVLELDIKDTDDTRAVK